MKKLIAGLLIGMMVAVAGHAATGYEVVANNSDAVKQYNQKLPIAKQFVADVLTENQRSETVLMKYREQGLSPDVPAQGKKFMGLREKGYKLFGDTVFIEPFGRCGAFGASAGDYWQSRLSNSLDQPAFKKMMTQSLKDCRSQIANPPERTVTIKAPGGFDKPPFKGCLAMLDLTTTNPAQDTQWTCPERAVKKAVQ